MLWLSLQFIALAAVVAWSGVYLTRFGDVIAERTGLGRTLVGLVLMAGATSLPELAVDCSAVTMAVPAPDLAVGAIVGSSVFNLFILGLMEYLHGTSYRIISPASRGHALPAICSMVLTALVATFILIPTSWTWLGIGLGPPVIFAAYLLFLWVIYLDQMHDPRHDEELGAGRFLSLRQAALGYMLMTVVIFIAARYLAPTADQIANRSGLGNTFVGTTFVAITTSLPELVTTLAAVRMGAFDMAVGNIFGSNAFNASILLPVDCCYREGSLLHAASEHHAVTAMAVIVITCVILTAILYRPARRHPLLNLAAGLVMTICALCIFAIYCLSRADF
jgi:cation:H+ antiporter